MFKSAFFYLILAINLVLCGCATLQELVKRPTVSFQSVSLQDMSLFEATPVFKFKVNNPNPMGANVTNIAYNLEINDKKFFKGVSDKGMVLKAGGSETLDLPVTFNYLDLFDSVTGFLNSDKVNYVLNGSMNVGPFAIPYKTKGSLDIPKIPKISLNNVKLSNFSMMGAKIEFDMSMKNSNPFSVNMSGLNYGIKLGGQEFASGLVKNIKTIGKNGESSVKVPLEVDFLKLGTSVYKLLKGSSTGYELTGDMAFNVPKLGIKSFPFKTTGNVPLIK